MTPHVRHVPSTKTSRGYALTLALVLMVVTLAAAALLAGALRHQTWELTQEEVALHLTSLCDAGLAEAMARLSVNPGWSGLLDEPLDRGTFTVVVENRDRLTRSVTVRARYRTGKRAVEALVQLNASTSPRVVSWRRLPSEL